MPGGSYELVYRGRECDDATIAGIDVDDFQDCNVTVNITGNLTCGLITVDQQPTTCGANDGAVTIIPTAGTTPYTFLFEDS